MKLKKKLKGVFLALLIGLSTFSSLPITSMTTVYAESEGDSQSQGDGGSGIATRGQNLWIIRDDGVTGLTKMSSADDWQSVYNMTASQAGLSLNSFSATTNSNIKAAIAQAYNNCVSNYQRLYIDTGLTTEPCQPRVVAVGVRYTTDYTTEWNGVTCHRVVVNSTENPTNWQRDWYNSFDAAADIANLVRKDGSTYTKNDSFMNGGETNLRNSSLSGINAYTVFKIVVLDQNTPAPQNKDITVNVTKTSMYPECTNGNALYSLAGAEFSVTASDGTDLGTLTTDANGNASQTYNVSYNVDSVTITETKAPDNYKITDGTPKVVTLDNNNTASYTVADEPINDPARITLTKVDKEGKAVASSMDEAQFTITYYDTLKDSEVNDSHKKAEWVIKTKATTSGSNTMYVARLDDEHFVSGDALYRDNDNNPIIPLGTITIQETQAPASYKVDGGYLLNNTTKDVVSSTETMTFKIVNENSAAVMKAGNLVADGSFIKEEMPIRGGFKLQKNDSEYWTRAQGDATLAGAEFDRYYLGSGEDSVKRI